MDSSADRAVSEKVSWNSAPTSGGDSVSEGDAGRLRVWLKHSEELSVKELLTGPQTMRPTPAAETWDVPAVESTGDLAKWLGLGPGEMGWFADLKGLGYKQGTQPLRHYHYRVLAKRFGRVRLIEAPKPRLKDRQRQILIWILEKVPPHPAVHGFVKGRSIKTFVAPHVGKRVVLRMDLRDFFPTFGGVRIQNVFRTLGYPEAVADLLGGICTNATPRDVWNDLGPQVDQEGLNDARRLYARPHLPQGAPSSPALANISFYRVDCRLSALAKSRVRTIRAMRMTVCSPATASSRSAWNDSACTSLLFFCRRASG